MPLQNFGLVYRDPNGARLWRCAQPDYDGFWQLSKMMGDGKGEGAVCFKLNQPSEGLDDEFTGVVQQCRVGLLDPDPKGVSSIARDIMLSLKGGNDVVAHCTHGRDRTGCVIGAFRVIFQGWTVAAAWEEMKVFGVGGIIALTDLPIHECLEKIWREVNGR